MEVMNDIKVEKYSEYKDSGEEWLGEIPKHWNLSRLGVLLTPVSIRNRVDLPLLSITREKAVILRDIENENGNHNFIPDDLSNYKVLKKGQFGMNKMKAWQGSYGISDYDGIVSPAYFIFDLKNTISPKYFHAAIRSKLYVSFFGSASDGVRIGQWDLSKERMKQIPFLIPPIKEQTAIAEFLDRKTASIDQAIDIKEKQIQLLKERRQIVIHQAVTRGLNPKVKMKDSGVEWIGEVPEHWGVKRLKYVSEIEYGISPHEKTYNDIGEGTVLINGPVEYSKADFGYTRSLKWTTAPVKFAKKGSLLFCLRGSTTGRLNICHQNVSIGRGCAAIMAKENHSFLIKAVMALKDRIVETFKGSTFPSVTSSDLNNYSIAVPPLIEQELISKHIDEMELKLDSAISLKEKEIEKLKEYKSTLINSAVTGKIKVC